MNKYLQIALVSVLLAAHFMLGCGAIKALSPTYDEPVHLAAGYSYLEADDYRYNTLDHPPFLKMWAALPLLFTKTDLPVHHPYWKDIRMMRYQYPFSNLFLYHNRADAEKMMSLGRGMVLILSCALGFMVFICAKDMFGPLSGLIALALWCFMPAAIGNGTLVTTDTALSLFYFTSVYLFKKLYLDNEAGKRPGWKKIALFGVSFGLLFASKYSAVGILPALFIPLFYLYTKNVRAGLNTLINLIVASAVAFVTLLIIYRFNDIGVYFLEGLKNIIFGAKGVSAGRSSFLMGQYSTTGWIYYFPVTFLLKTPIPLLVLTAMAVYFKKSWTKENILFLLVPAGVYFSASCMSKVQIGHRHILVVYPFLMVWVSGLVSYTPNRYFKYLMAGLVVLFAASSVKVHPWYLSYFNEFIASPDEGYKYLTDSNLDWGQGLKALGKYLKDEDAGGIYLCYFGTGDPSYYGIKYVPIGFIDGISPPYTEHERTGDIIDFNSQKNVFFAISATNLQATYYADKNVFAFLKNIKPKKIVANSIFVYDLKANPVAYAQLKEMFVNKKD